MLVHNEKVKWANKIGQNKLKLLKITCNKIIFMLLFQGQHRPTMGLRYNQEKADPHFNFISICFHNKQTFSFGINYKTDMHKIGESYRALVKFLILFYLQYM